MAFGSIGETLEGACVAAGDAAERCREVVAGEGVGRFAGDFRFFSAGFGAGGFGAAAFRAAFFAGCFFDGDFFGCAFFAAAFLGAAFFGGDFFAFDGTLFRAGCFFAGCFFDASRLAFAFCAMLHLRPRFES